MTAAPLPHSRPASPIRGRGYPGGVDDEIDSPDQSGRPTVSVVVPTYNEAENIAELLDRLGRALAGVRHEVIVVDDNSPDETWQTARAHASGNPAVRVIRRFEDRGLSSAVLAGMAVAEGRALAVIDADLQHDETALPEMVRSVTDGGSDVCIGTRWGPGGSLEEMPPIRRFCSRAVTLLARTLVTRTRTTDPLSGYFVISRSAYEATAPAIKPRGFKILLEFLGRGRDLRLSEVGYRFRARRRGETKLSANIVRNDLITILDLASDAVRRRFSS